MRSDTTKADMLLKLELEISQSERVIESNQKRIVRLQLLRTFVQTAENAMDAINAFCEFFC